MLLNVVEGSFYGFDATDNGWACLPFAFPTATRLAIAIFHSLVIDCYFSLLSNWLLFSFVQPSDPIPLPATCIHGPADDVSQSSTTLMAPVKSWLPQTRIIHAVSQCNPLLQLVHWAYRTRSHSPSVCPDRHCCTNLWSGLWPQQLLAGWLEVELLPWDQRSSMRWHSGGCVCVVVLREWGFTEAICYFQEVSTSTSMKRKS